MCSVNSQLYLCLRALKENRNSITADIKEDLINYWIIVQSCSFTAAFIFIC